MAYVAPTTINPGDPVTATAYNVVVNDILDHETRLGATEAFAQRVSVFEDEVKNGTGASSLTGVAFFRAPVDFILTEAKVTIFTKGTLTGTVEVDVHRQNSLSMVGSVSVFLTKPSLDFSTAVDYDESSNAVFGANATITEGQYIRLDVTQLPVNGVLSRFYITIFGEV